MSVSFLYLYARLSASIYHDRDLTRRHGHQHHHQSFSIVFKFIVTNMVLTMSIIIHLTQLVDLFRFLSSSGWREIRPTVASLTGTHLRVLNRHLLNSLPEFLALFFLRFV